MHIVLTGGWPDARVARAVLPRIEQTAPALVRWLARGRVCVQTASSQALGCTAEEWWRLHLAGYRARAGQNCAAGLGPLFWREGKGSQPRLPVLPPDQPVWLAELVHIAPTQHGAGLLTARDLNIRVDEDRALFDTLQVLENPPDRHSPDKNGGFTLLRLYADLHPGLRPGLWQVGFAADFAPDVDMICASPAFLARPSGSGSVTDWWPQQAAARRWRRWFNEVQMRWFDHPVNRQRQQRGEPAINALWLFGGATGAQLTTPQALEKIHWHDELLPSFVQQDWGAWLDALARLDEALFARHLPLSRLDVIGQDTSGNPRVAQIHFPSNIGDAAAWRTMLHKLTGKLPPSQPWKKWWIQD